jgi:hypothetical protein
LATISNGEFPIKGRDQKPTETPTRVKMLATPTVQVSESGKEERGIFLVVQVEHIFAYISMFHYILPVFDQCSTHIPNLM